jgi:hypothetical protein
MALSDSALYQRHRANLQALLDACAQVGVRGIICFGMGVTMREGNREYFYQQLDRLFPGMRAQYIRKFALQYELSSDRADMLMQLLQISVSAMGSNTGSMRILPICVSLRQEPLKQPVLAYYSTIKEQPMIYLRSVQMNITPGAYPFNCPRFGS